MDLKMKNDEVRSSDMEIVPEQIEKERSSMHNTFTKLAASGK